MIPPLFEVTTTGTSYILLGGFITVFSLFAVVLKEQLFLNEVVLGTLFGIIIGPHGLNFFDPRSWASSPAFRFAVQNNLMESAVVNVVTHEIMRVVLATGLFAIGVELPKSYLAKHVKGLVVLVVPTMAIGWIVVSVMIKCVVPVLGIPSCLVIAACLTPTDPVICSSIVGGRFAKDNVPRRLRDILSAESAANDGMAYPFLVISMLLVLRNGDTDVLLDWLLIGWLYQVVLGILLGIFIGLGFSRFMKKLHKSGLMNNDSYLIQYLALSIFTVGAVSTIGSDDLLAAFAAGSAISWNGEFNSRTEDQSFAHILDFILNSGCFVYIGAWMPFRTFLAGASLVESLTGPTLTSQLGLTPAKLICLLVGILLLRRIPAILVLYNWVPEIETWKEALFAGHFGPMGVGALFMATMALKQLPTRAEQSKATNASLTQNNQQLLLAEALETIVAFVILGSIFVHGLSAPIYTLFIKFHRGFLAIRYNSSTQPMVDELPHQIPTSATHSARHSAYASIPSEGERLNRYARPKSFGTFDGDARLGSFRHSDSHAPELQGAGGESAGDNARQ